MKRIPPPGSGQAASLGTALTRRAFLQQSMMTAGLLAIPAFVPARILGQDSTAPSNRITVGLIGRGAMGSGHLHRVAHDPGFQLLAVCDVDETRREQGRATAEQIYTSRQDTESYKGCKAYNDYREILAREDIDAVLIATPDHWHAQQSIDAAKAGKDVYCEKPVSMTIKEGRRIVEAVKRYGRVYQTGTQYRSIPAIRRVCQFIRDGGLGKIRAVFTPYQPLSNFLGGERIEAHRQTLSLEQCARWYAPMDFALPEDPVPAGLDWDMWVGPAPWRPYNKLYHINPSPGVVPWSFCDAFGVTSSTWFLSHAADVIQWALGYENSGPVEVIHPTAGSYPTMTCKYANGTLLHLVDHWGQVKELYHALPEDARLGGNFGGVFVGERGWVTTMSAGGRIEGAPESLFEEMNLRRTPEVNIGSNTHHKNWLECVHSRQSPNANEEIGHRSASLGHLANLSSILGRSLNWDPVRELFIGDEAANRMLSRAQRAPWRM